MLEDDTNALRYAKRGVDLGPEDPYNNWNLGRLYDYANELELADTYYARALLLFGSPTNASGSYCTYAEFLKNKRRRPREACKAAKNGCAERKDEYCD